MELKITTKRALEFESRTNKDILVLLQEIEKTSEIKVRDVVELFIACGENYTLEMFDAWDAPFEVKAEEVIRAVAYYVGGSASPKKRKK